MSYFSLLRPLLFSLEPEQAHNLAIFALKNGLVPAQPNFEHPLLHTECWGISFKNPVGLAAGFDKDAECVKSLASQGFGFVELGTVTPLPQPGNEKPRLFRLEEDEAIINRFGFNSKGLAKFCKNLTRNPQTIPIGGNIGKNKTSDGALIDYSEALKQVYPLVEYITVNISSPNTQGLRNLQGKAALDNLLEGICGVKQLMESEHGEVKPLLVKIAPDLTSEALDDLLEVITMRNIDGLIVSNTTIDRPDGLKDSQTTETGGLSGAPLKDRANTILREVFVKTEGRIPLIGVGGISSGMDAYERIRSGASLVQVYSALIYQGFDLVSRIKKELVELLEKDGVKQLSHIVGVDCRK